MWPDQQHPGVVFDKGHNDSIAAMQMFNAKPGERVVTGQAVAESRATSTGKFLLKPFVGFQSPSSKRINLQICDGRRHYVVLHAVTMATVS